MRNLQTKKSPSALDMLPVVLLAALLLSGEAFAATTGQVTHLSGMLSAKRTDGSEKILSVKSEIQEGDMLTTEAETYARIKFSDGGEVVLRPGSQLKVESYSYNAAKPENDNVALSLLKGGLRAVTGLLGRRNKEKVSFTTNTATIGIRGTHFGALLCQGDCSGIPTVSGIAPPDGLHVDVAAGSVVVSNAAGQQQINAGQFGYVPGPSEPPQIVAPQQGIQVTMPANIAQDKAGGRGVGKSGEAECKM